MGDFAGGHPAMIDRTEIAVGELDHTITPAPRDAKRSSSVCNDGGVRLGAQVGATLAQDRD